MTGYENCYLNVETLYRYCKNQKDNLLTPNDFLRMPMTRIVCCKDCRHRDPEDHKCDDANMASVLPKDDYDFCSHGRTYGDY